jgi:hypothetical protein
MYIKTSGKWIYTIVARPTLMPYIDARKWVFSHLDKDACTILNERKHLIASLRTEDIHIQYKLTYVNITSKHKIDG